MHAGIDIDAVERIAAECAMDNGLEVYDVELTNERGRTILRVLVERQDRGSEEERVTINECANLSRELSLSLDAEDPIDIHYVLEVSSPGVERPLTKEDHFERAQGEFVLLVLDADVEGKTDFEGVLEDVTADVLKLKLPPKAKRRKKGQPKKEIPIEEWEGVDIPKDTVRKAKTIYALSIP